MTPAGASTRSRDVRSSVTALGVDVGGTKIAAGLVEPDGRLVDAGTAPTPADGDAVVERVAEIIADYRSRSPVDHVGVAVPGGVDPYRGVVTAAANLDWADLQLAERIRARVPGIELQVDNDADAAAWAEYRFGGHPAGNSLVLVTVGTGIGGGLVLGNQLLRGHYGAGAEVGHMPLQLDGRPCGCGSRGCWEQYASGRALQRAAGEAGWTTPDAAPAVLAAAALGDWSAGAVVAEVATALAHGLTLLTAVLDPALVVLGGGLGTDSRFLPFVLQARDRIEVSPPRVRTPIRTAALGSWAGVIGAAELARIGGPGAPGPPD